MKTIILSCIIVCIGMFHNVLMAQGSYYYSDFDLMLIKACEDGELAIAKEALEQGAHINVQVDKGITPLLMAVQSGDSTIVSFLLHNGAKADILTYDYLSPLHLAVADSNIGITEALLIGGANINIEDASRRTPLHYAVERNYWLLADMLMYYGANINATDIRGIAPVHIASDAGFLRTLIIILDHVPEVNITDSKGNTALHYAAKQGDTIIAETLIDYGADINIKNRAGYSPFMVAVANNQFGFVKYLDENFYLDFNETASLSRNVLTLAQRTQNQELISYLKDKGAVINRRPELGGTYFGINQIFNFNDYWLDVDFRFREIKYKVELGVSYSIRPYYQRVLVLPPKDIKTQYWERKSNFNLILQKNFEFKETWALSMFVKPGISTGKYRGANTKPLINYYITPGLLFSRDWSHLRLSVGYQYFNIKNEHIPDHRFIIGLGYKFYRRF